jgi:hypothetical protein
VIRRGGFKDGGVATAGAEQQVAAAAYTDLGVAKPATPDTEADRLSRDEEEAQIRRAPAELVADILQIAPVVRDTFSCAPCVQGGYILTCIFVFCF